MTYAIYILLAALIVAIIDCYIERRQHRRTGDALCKKIDSLNECLRKIKEYENGKG